MARGASSASPSQVARKIRAVHRRHGYEFPGKRVQTRAPDDSNPAPPSGRRMSLNLGYQERIRQAIGTPSILDLIQGAQRKTTCAGGHVAVVGFDGMRHRGALQLIAL